MILTVQELRNYSPTLSILGDLESEGLILRSQSLCESSLGANRELEIKNYQEIKTLINNLQVPLIFTPIINVTSVEIKYNNLFTSFCGLSVNQGWEVLPAEEYTVNENYLEINHQNIYSFNNYGNNYRNNCRNNYRGGRPRVTQEIRVSYSAGLDFSLATQEILKIKSLISSIAEVMYREQKIIKEESSQGAKIVYQDFKDLKPYANYLPLFYKYRPRT